MKRYDSYKPSGISWIEEIPSHWEVFKIKNVINSRKAGSWGDDYPKEEDTDWNYCLRIADFDYPSLRFKREILYTKRKYSESDKIGRFLEQDDILIEKSGGGENTPVGRAVMFDLKLANVMYANFMERLRVRDNINSKFLVYVFSAIYNTKEIWRFIRFTTGLQNLNMQSFLSDCYIPVPSLAEQEKIVEFLATKTSQIDVQVADREREIQLLNELKQAEIANVVTRGLNPDVPMKDSGIPWIGQIPAHWEVKRISSQFHDKVQSNSDYTITHAHKFNYGTLVPKNESGDISEYKDTYLGYSLLQVGDIVINGLNLNYDFVSQRVAIAEDDCIITSAYLPLRPYHATYPEYFLWLFKAMDSKKLFHGMGTGIRLTLSFNELKAQLIPIPPIEEQRAIVEYIQKKNSAIDDMIANLKAEIEFLTEYKQRLIADAVTGQIKVD